MRNLRLKNQQIHQKQANRYEDFANNIFLQITKLFISLSVFVLTFTSPVFLQIENLQIVEKVLLFIGWVFLLISILFGIIQLFCEKKFYEDNARYYTNITMLYSVAKDDNGSLEKVEEQKAMETAKNFKYQSLIIPFAFQLFCFSIGLTFILIVFYFILFK